jgi:hypothetical protein
MIRARLSAYFLVEVERIKAKMEGVLGGKVREVKRSEQICRMISSVYLCVLKNVLRTDWTHRCP